MSNRKKQLYFYIASAVCLSSISLFYVYHIFLSALVGYCINIFYVETNHMALYNRLSSCHFCHILASCNLNVFFAFGDPWIVVGINFTTLLGCSNQYKIVYATQPFLIVL